MRRRLCAVLLCCLPLLSSGTASGVPSGVSSEAVAAAPVVRVRAAPADDPSGAGAGAGAGRVRPVPGAVERDWRPPPVRWAAGHRGVDLAARPGDPVRAVGAGRVSFAGEVAGRGVVSIELSGTGDPPLRTTYEPVRARVREGDRIATGQVVGVLEADGFHCPAGCLHWGLRRGGAYLDPFSVLGSGPSRLLPVLGVPLPEAAGGGPDGVVRPVAAGRSSSGETAVAGAVALALAAATVRARRRRIRSRGGRPLP